MASRTDSERYEHALKKWDTLQESDCFSVPQEVGTCAVLLAYNHSRDADPGVRDRFPMFVKDALAISDQLHAQGKNVELSLDTSRDDFDAVIKDETISDIVVIGNGVLSRVFLPAPEKRVGWGHIARMTDHLKTGTFTQRFCGGTPDYLNVPMGIMAVSKHSNVHAPVRQYFTPRSSSSPHNQRIQPVTNMERMSLTDIKESFPERRGLTLEQKSNYTLNSLRRIAVLATRVI
jgi:hypothetical protein